MRTFAGLVALLICLSGLPAAAQKIDLDSPEGQIAAFRKIQCSTEDGKVYTYGWHGTTYSRVPGEPDRALFRVEGMNIRQCVTVSDPEQGEGFRLITREILLYQDPKTGAVLRNWDNPWTGETVEVLHVANDPVNQGPIFPSERFKLPYSINGSQWWLTSAVPLFYTNPLGGEFQQYVGGTYHATEMFNFFGEVEALLDPDIDSVPTRVGWVRLSSWLPWMQMGDRAGILYFHTAGRKLDSFDDLSPVMKQEIAERYPEYDQPPPADDDRPNETSWTYFRKVMESRRRGRVCRLRIRTYWRWGRCRPHLSLSHTDWGYVRR